MVRDVAGVIWAVIAIVVLSAMSRRMPKQRSGDSAAPRPGLDGRADLPVGAHERDAAAHPGSPGDIGPAPPKDRGVGASRGA